MKDLPTLKGLAYGVEKLSILGDETPKLLGEFELHCYLLNNEMRVLSQREVVKLITGGRESGNLDRYLNAKAIQDFLPKKFKAVEEEKKRNVLIFKAGTTIAHFISDHFYY